MAAPPVLEFDAAGEFVQAWGGDGSGYEWPQREHGIYVDHTDHVWIGGNNNKERKLPLLKPINDDQILKFTRSGTFVLQIGRSDQSGGDADTRNVRQPADLIVYPKTNELFVADGYGNHRLIVFDAGSGAFRRMWGAFGSPPLDVDRRPPPAASRPAGQTGPEHFDTVHSVRVSNDGLVDVADRGNKRVQVFTLDGRFLSQASIAPETEACPRVRWHSLRTRNSHCCMSVVSRRSGCSSARRSRRLDRLPARTPIISPPTRKATSTRPKPKRAGHESLS